MKKETKNAVKGLLLWIINNVLTIIVFDSAYVFFKNIVLFNEISTAAVLQFIISGIPWIISGSMIIGSFVDSKKKCDEIVDTNWNLYKERKILWIRLTQLF